MEEWQSYPVGSYLRPIYFCVSLNSRLESNQEEEEDPCGSVTFAISAPISAPMPLLSPAASRNLCPSASHTLCPSASYTLCPTVSHTLCPTASHTLSPTASP